MTAPDESAYAPHELFLPENEDDPIVHPVYISVKRISPTVDNTGGVMPASELPNVATLARLYGGGVYEVYARDSRRVILARRKVGPIPGKPRPMFVPLDEEQAAALRAELEAAETPAPAKKEAKEGTELLTFLMALQERQSQETRALIERIERSSNAAIERSERFAQSLITTVTTFANGQVEMARQQAQQAAAMPVERAGGDPMERFFEGVEFAKGILEKQAEQAAEGDDMAKTIAMVVEGMKALKGTGSGTPEGSSTAPRPAVTTDVD